MIGWLPRLVAGIPATVYTKLLIAFLSIVVMFAAIGAVGLSMLSASNERALSLVNAQKRIAVYRLLQRNTVEQHYTVTSAMVKSDILSLAAAKRRLNQFAYDFEHTEYLSQEDAEIITDLQAEYRTLIDAGMQVIDLVRAAEPEQASEYQRRHAKPLADSLEQRINALVNRAETTVIESAEISRRGYVTSQYVVFGVALGGVLFALILGYSISLSLITPVKQMNRRFHDIAMGDFSGRIEVANRDEMGKLASALNEMSVELGGLYSEIQAASKHKSEFLANMSHELRTPLNAIIGFSEALDELMFGELNDKQAEYVRDIHESGEHLLSLINDILDLSKVEAGRMELYLKKFDLNAALENAVILVRERSLRYGIPLALNLDTDLGDIVADERMFKQILLNLMSNAIKFTRKGGHITIKAAVDAEWLQVAVTDTGIGISAEDQQFIFEEFRQIGQGHDQASKGTGLGLMLTKKFIEMHGGDITLESALGKGSTFEFRLPLAPSENLAADAGTEIAAATILNSDQV